MIWTNYHPIYLVGTTSVTFHDFIYLFRIFRRQFLWQSMKLGNRKRRLVIERTSNVGLSYISYSWLQIDTLTVQFVAKWWWLAHYVVAELFIVTCLPPRDIKVLAKVQPKIPLHVPLTGQMNAVTVMRIEQQCLKNTRIYDKNVQNIPSLNCYMFTSVIN